MLVGLLPSLFSTLTSISLQIHNFTFLSEYNMSSIIKNENSNPNLPPSSSKSRSCKSKPKSKPETENASRRWTKEESDKLFTIVAKYKEDPKTPLRSSDWIKVADEMQTRNSRSCRSRYARKSFTALTPGKKEPTLKKILSVSEASRPIFASPKPVQQAHLPFPMKNAATTASASELYQPQPQMNQQLVHRYDLPRPSFQWSPFVFQRTYEFDSETNGDADMNGEISSGEEEISSPQSSGLSLDLDLTPLDFYAEDDVPLHKIDTDALLYFLNADNGRNGEKSNAPAPAPCGEGTTETARAYATGSFTYSDSAETSWSHSLMARDLICSPVFSTNYDRSMMTGSTSKPMRISTPPSKVITEQEKFSAISNLTGPKTRSRKKPRLSSKEGNVDMTLSVPFNDSIANVPRTPPVPSLEVAEDLDIVWTDRKAYFRLGVVARNVASAWNTPTRKRNANDHIYQALSSRGSRSDPRNRKAFGITPHLPTSILKAYHSEPRRISKPSSILTGASIQPLTELRPKNNLPCLPSPIQHVGKDMNRILFGLDSPSSSAGGSTVDDF